MPIDPRIPLGAEPPQIDPVGAISQVMGLEQQARQGEIQQMQLEDVQRERQQREQWGRAIQGAYKDDGTLDEEAFLGAVPPELVPDAQRVIAETRDRLAKFQQAQRTAKRQELFFLANQVRTLAYNPTAFGTALKTAAGSGLMSEDEATEALQQALNGGPDGIQQIVDSLLASTPEGQKALEPKYQEVGGAVIDINRPQAGAVYTPEEKTKPVYRVSADKRTLEQVGEIPAGAQVVSEPQPPRISVHANMTAADDVKTLAQQVKDGLLLPSMLSKRDNFNAILAEANRLSLKESGRPLDPRKLEIEYRAAQRWVGTQNGSQMQRFYGLAQSVVNTIDEVKDLAEQMKQGGVKLWNRAKRESLRHVYGNTPYSEAANRYMVAVNTLREEFANLAQGGYAPTEAAWKLANDQINADFGVKDFTASINEVQRLIRYRLDAMQTTPIRTPYSDAPPAAPAPAAPASGGMPSYQDYLRAKGKKP